MISGIVVLALLLLFTGTATAHCPLCTAGAGIAATAAAYFGVDLPVIGLFIGAFAVSTGWWAANRLEEQYSPYQTPAIVIASFILTVLPVAPLIGEQYAHHIGIVGGYGTLLNRTYTINLSLLTAAVGGGIVAIGPRMSQGLTAIREVQLPFQGIVLTFSTLLLTGIIIQVI